MKVLLLLSLATLALANDYNLEFEEGNKKFVQKVKVDVAANIEEVVVPKHFDRPALDLLKDFNKGLKAERVEIKKECYISALTSEDDAPSQVQASMVLSRGKFPTSRYQIINNMVLPIGKMTEGEVGAKIAAHCQGYKLIRVLIASKEKINALVTKMIREQKASGRSKRDVTVQTFGACTLSSTNVVNGCPPSKLATVCKFIRQDQARCVYSLTCPITNSGFRCSGKHVFSSPTCCDFVCNR